jgi:hypothetical protein
VSLRLDEKPARGPYIQSDTWVAVVLHMVVLHRVQEEVIPEEDKRTEEVEDNKPY